MKRIAMFLAIIGLLGLGNPVLAFERLPESSSIQTLLVAFPGAAEQIHGHHSFLTIACDRNEDSPKGKCAQACRDEYLACTGSYHAKQDDCTTNQTACEAKCGC